MTVDTFHPLTLSHDLGTLTIVWVVPLSEVKFTPRLPVSRLLRHEDIRSWTRGRSLSEPKPQIRLSTISTTSAEA